MAGNPLVPQGVINRLRASVNVIDVPSLNVSAPFLGKAGISMQLDGKATSQIGTMTGIVNSPEPYIMVMVKIPLLKTQSLGALYKARMQANSQLGDIIVTPDAASIGTFYIYNASIESVDNMSLAGDDPHFAASLSGYWLLNSELWNLLAS